MLALLNGRCTLRCSKIHESRFEPRQIAAIAERRCTRELELMISWRDHLVRHATLEAAYLKIVRHDLKFRAFLSINSCRSSCAISWMIGDDVFVLARRRASIPQPATDLHEGSFGGRRRGSHSGLERQAPLAIGRDAGDFRPNRGRCLERSQFPPNTGSVAIRSTWLSI